MDGTGRKSEEKILSKLLEVGRLLVSDLDLDRVLGRVLEAAAEMTDARYAALGVLDPSHHRLERFVHTGIDKETVDQIGELPSGRGVLGVLIREPKPVCLAEVSEHPASFGFPEGHPPMHTFLGVPISIRGRQWGNLYLTEKRGGEPFDDEDERIAVALADWAAVAIGNARSVADERLRLSMEAAEQERLQWARELHDQTLQGLAAVRMLLKSGSRSGSERLERAVAQSLVQIDSEITSMRALISDLRPEAIDQTGILGALESLAERVQGRPGGPDVDVVLPPEELTMGKKRLPSSVELAIYRVAQEALTNAVRHGSATAVRLELSCDDNEVCIGITDNGSGFDPADAQLGYGIIGMRERAELSSGRLTVESSPGSGAEVQLRVPRR